MMKIVKITEGNETYYSIKERFLFFWKYRYVITHDKRHIPKLVFSTIDNAKDYLESFSYKEEILEKYGKSILIKVTRGKDIFYIVKFKGKLIESYDRYKGIYLERSKYYSYVDYGTIINYEFWSLQEARNAAINSNIKIETVKLK